MFSLICVCINGWVNNRKAGDLRRYRAHYDVIVMWKNFGTPALRSSLDRFTAYLQMSILPQTDRQGTMDMLFNQASVASPGTYYNMKQVFNHRSLHGNVQNNVQHVWDMIQVQLPVKCITIYHIIHRTWLNYLVMCNTLKGALSPWGYEHPSKKEWHAADSLTSLEHTLFNGFFRCVKQFIWHNDCNGVSIWFRMT